MPKKIRILLAASEVSPLAQTGGLAEVAGSLPKAFQAMGHPTTVVMPAYRQTLRLRAFSETISSLTVMTGGQEVAFSVLSGTLADGVPVLLIRCDEYFDRPGIYEDDGLAYSDNHDRYAFFCKAVMAVMARQPDPFDIVVANDWQTGLLMPYLDYLGPEAPAGVFVIHNQGFLGLAPAAMQTRIGLPDEYFGLEGMEYFGQLSYLKAGIVYSKAVVTVSPSYAREIQTPEGGNGLDGVMQLYSGKLRGIVNGVDYQAWNPASDQFLPARYSASDPAGKKKCKLALKEEVSLPPGDRPLFSMVSRLTAQKGISLLIEGAADIFKLGLDVIVLGTGESWFENQLSAMVDRFPLNMRLILGYDNELAHRIIAGSDFVLVPSAYEPCGLVQLYALRYGTIPVVRAAGGLNDTVRDYAGQNPEGLWDNGFKFTQFQAPALARAIRRAAELYRTEDFAAMSQRNMLEDHSWARSAGEYVEVFRKILGLNG
ncbi:MAG: glycogen synthase GlgA [Deltaproteobacteria bacterium]|jgi:starch synthase|nr:glycogen synthase GlgA [Deltaproteobacteria bacterium]